MKVARDCEISFKDSTKRFIKKGFNKLSDKSK